jgi:hypothetical protein
MGAVIFQVWKQHASNPEQLQPIAIYVHMWVVLFHDGGPNEDVPFNLFIPTFYFSF